MRRPSYYVNITSIVPSEFYTLRATEKVLMGLDSGMAGAGMVGNDKACVLYLITAMKR